MVLPDTVVLDHLLQCLMEALQAQPEPPLVLQFLLSLEKLHWLSEHEDKPVKQNTPDAEFFLCASVNAMIPCPALILVGQ